MVIDTGVKKKRILLLGSCGVLGRAHSQILSDLGAKLILADRPGSGVVKYAQELQAVGIEIDVADEMSIVDGIKKGCNIYDGIDAAIYNVAITSELLASSDENKYTLENYPLTLWNSAISVNLTGAFLFAKAVSPFLKASKGSLINVASVYGVVGPDHRIYEGQPFQSFPAYSASKAGLIGLTKWISTLWASDGVRVNSVSPGGVFNNHNESFTSAYGLRTPMGRMANKNEITGILVYLVSDSSQYCTGQNFSIDGGLSAW